MVVYIYMCIYMLQVHYPAQNWLFQQDVCSMTRVQELKGFCFPFCLTSCKQPNTFVCEPLMLPNLLRNLQKSLWQICHEAHRSELKICSPVRCSLSSIYCESVFPATPLEALLLYMSVSAPWPLYLSSVSSRRLLCMLSDSRSIFRPACLPRQASPLK